MSEHAPTPEPRPRSSVASVGLYGRCPRCGQGNLFNGWLRLSDKCSVCALNYEFADTGDGPAVFVILILGGLLMGLVLWTEFTYAPPFWVHVVIWPLFTGVVTVLLLRFIKGVLVALQYQRDAREGRIADDS